MSASAARYRSNSKPAVTGIGLGGRAGRERLFLDEDFETATVRHHAVDKTFQPGLLFPGQVSVRIAY